MASLSYLKKHLVYFGAEVKWHMKPGSYLMPALVWGMLVIFLGTPDSSAFAKNPCPGGLDCPLICTFADLFNPVIGAGFAALAVAMSSTSQVPKPFEYLFPEMNLCIKKTMLSFLCIECIVHTTRCSDLLKRILDEFCVFTGNSPKKGEINIFWINKFKCVTKRTLEYFCPSSNENSEL